LAGSAACGELVAAGPCARAHTKEPQHSEVNNNDSSTGFITMLLTLGRSTAQIGGFDPLLDTDVTH
jgi:hypothetical protein